MNFSHPLQLTRRDALRALAVSALGMTGAAGARIPTTGTVKLIVGFPAGGSADAVARATAIGLGRELRLPVVVENRPGGQLAISMQALTGAPPDGLTLMYMTGTYLAMQATQRLFTIDTQTTPIVNTIATPIVMLVRAESPLRTVADLVEAAKRGKDPLPYGVIGLGGIEHFKMAQMEKAAGFKGLPVPYRGGPDGVNALLAGDISCMLVPGIFAKNFAGKLRTLAVLGELRWQQLPDVPTLRESGVNVPPTSYWGGWVAPAGLSQETTAQLAEVLTRVSRQPDVLAQLLATGHDLRLTDSPEQFREQMRAELVWMNEVARSEGLIAK